MKQLKLKAKILISSIHTPMRDLISHNLHKIGYHVVSLEYPAFAVDLLHEKHENKVK